MAKYRTPFVVLMLFLLLGAALGQETLVFPNDPSVLNLKRDFGAVGDGLANDTVALQRAFDASGGTGGPSKLLFLPNGVYLVTNTLVVHTLGPWVYGESRDGVTIRLVDGAARVITNCTSVIRTHPNDTAATSSDYFMRNFHNFTVDVGQNPGVDGIRWYGNNTSILKDMRVRGNGVGGVGINSGFIGLNGPNIIQDTTIEGFDTGISAPFVWGETISRVTIRNCRKQGIYVLANAAAIEDLTVADTPIAVNVDNYPPYGGWNGVAAIVGGRFTGGDSARPAITNTGSLYVRNVTTTGYKQAVVSSTSGGNVAGTQVNEYLSSAAVKLYPDAPSRSFQLPIKPEPTLAWETNLSRWISANSYGASYGKGADNTAAFQRAIDAAAAQGATVVYLRGSDGGTYLMNGEVRIHGSVRTFMALGWGRIVANGPSARFVVDDSSAAAVKFHNIQAFGGAPVTVENRSTNATLMVESSDMTVVGTGRGDIFVTDCACRVNLQSRGQSLWARQLNPEGYDDTGLVRNSGGRLWAMGVKHEGGGIRWLTDNGGLTEVFGLFNYSTAVQNNDPRPMFDVDNSAFCAMGVWEISFGNTYPIKLREVRNGQIRRTQAGGWTSWAMGSAWAAGVTNGPTAVALPVIEPAGSSFIETSQFEVNTGTNTWNWSSVGSFVGSLSLTAKTSTPGIPLRYTTDGSDPAETSPLLPTALTVSNSMVLKVKGFATNFAPSATAVANLTRLIPLAPLPSWTASGGLSYSYYEIPATVSKLPLFTNLTPRSEGLVTNLDLSPRRRDKGIAFVYNGFLTIPTAGIYRFHLTSSDGSRLWLGTNLVVDNDGLHGSQQRSGTVALAAGQYPLAVAYFNSTGNDTLALTYDGPGLSEQPVPASAYVVQDAVVLPLGRLSGAEYQYFEGNWTTLPNFDTISPVSSGLASNLSIGPRRRNLNYGLRFYGWIWLPTDGVWTFYTSSDDGSSLRLGGTKIVDNDGVHGMTERSGSIAAKAGFHPFIVEFFQGDGGQGLSVSYQGPGVAKQPVAAKVLFNTPPGLVSAGVENGLLSLTYLRAAYGPASQFQYALETSEDLKTWGRASSNLTQVDVLAGPPYSIISATWQAPISSSRQGFLRLSITGP